MGVPVAYCRVSTKNQQSALKDHQEQWGDIFEKEGLVENSEKMGKLFKAKLMDLKGKYNDKIVDVRGIGLLIGIELKPEIASKVFTKLFENKILTSLCKGLTIRIAPALNITEDEIDLFVDTFDKIMQEI